jgi:hypothetical protein
MFFHKESMNICATNQNLLLFSILLVEIKNSVVQVNYFMLNSGAFDSQKQDIVMDLKPN